MWEPQVVRSLLMNSEVLTEASGAGGGDRRARISILDTCEGEAFRRIERMWEPCVACQLSGKAQVHRQAYHKARRAKEKNRSHNFWSLPKVFVFWVTAS